MGSFVGAFVGSLLIGLADSVAFMLFPDIRAYIPYILMAGILLLRPEGLFGGVTHD
jgi:branched-subunit amino acid ABC-type transport system permease component